MTRWFQHICERRDPLNPRCPLCGMGLYIDCNYSAWPKKGATCYSKCGSLGEMYYQQREPIDWIACTEDGRQMSYGDKL